MSNNKKNKTISFETVEELVIEKKYDKAFNKASNLSCSDFERFIEKLVFPRFEELFDSTSAENYLHTYLSKCNHISEKFEQKLASEYPKLFVKAIRVNEVFLKRENIDAILSYSLPKECQIHQEVWKSMREIESSLWNSIEESLKPVLKLDIEEILVNASLWCNLKKEEYDSNNDNYDVHNVASSYNFFIRFYLHKKGKIQSLDKQKFHNYLSFYFYNGLINEPTKILLTNIDAYVRFQQDRFHAYCFEESTILSEDELTIFLGRFQSDIEKYQFDGERRVVNEHIYNTNYNENSPVSNSFKKESHNKVLKEEVRKVLTDLQVKELVYRKNGLKLTADATTLFDILIDTMIACNFDYDCPYFCFTKQEYIDWNNKLCGASKEDSEHIISIFAYYINPKNKFDRFKTDGYDAWAFPFIKFEDESIFCPTLFLANNGWFDTASSLASLKNISRDNKENQESVERQEAYFADIIKQAGFKIKIIDPNDIKENGGTGDVDILIYDGNDTILIQLKRTYLSLSLKDIYNEYANGSKTAVRQLNGAEEFLYTNNSFHTLKNKPTKWIISNSYEDILDEVDGCLKVNYFDILHVLRLIKPKSVKELIYIIENDILIKDIAKSYLKRLALNLSSHSKLELNYNYNTEKKKTNLIQEFILPKR